MGVGGAAKTLTLELVGKDTSLIRVLDNSGNRVDAFQKKVEGSNRSLSLSQRAVAGAAGAITALASGLTYAITKAVAFDKAMRNVNSLTKANEQTFAAMEKQVISMSTKLPQSATTLAEGLYDIASSGFQGADGIKVLDAAARSASAGMTTTAVSSRAITAVLNAYGLQAKDAADVSDVLFSTVNLGVISFDELANNLGDVVGATSAAKIGIDQVGAAIATMTLSGIKGAQATTALSSLTTKLVQPSAALAKVYEQLGYESGASALETKGLHGVMEDLRVATGGNITTMLKLFPDIEAARGALALMANEGQNYTKVADQITDKTKRMGATQEVLDEQMKSVSAQWQLFVNHIDAAAISIGVKLLPSLTKGMELTGDFATAIGKLAAEIKSRAASGLDDMGTSVENIIDLLQKLGEAILPTVEGLGKLAGGAVLTSFNLLASVLGDITQLASENETVVMALGIAYAVHATGGAASLYSMLGKVGPAMSALSTAGSAAYDFVAGLFTPGVEGAADSVTRLGDKAKSAGSKVKAAFMAMAPAAAIGGVLALAVVAWQNYSEAADRATKITKNAQKAMDSIDSHKLQDSLKESQDFLDETNQRLLEFGNKDHKVDMATLFQPGKNYELLGMVDNLEQVQAKADEAKQALGNMQYNTVELFKILGKPLPDAAKWVNDVQGANGVQAQATAMSQMDAVLTQLGPKLKAAGVDLTKGWDTQQMTNAYAALSSVKDGTDQTATAQKNLIEAMGVAATSMGDAETAADSLKSALDDLMGAAIGVDQAQINWSNNLDKLKTTLRDNGTSLSFNTTKGRENRQAIINQVESLQEILVAGAKAGDGQDVLAGKLETGRSALIKAATAAGINKGEMVALLAQYNLTPELVQTIISESGAAPTKEKLKELAAQADALGKKNPKPKVSAETTVAQSRLNAVQNRLDQIDGRNAAATVSVTENTYKNLVETHTVKPVGVLAPGNTGLNGGFFRSYADGNLPDQAKIQRAKGPYGLIQWAEPGTGDEAFIPMSPNKRERSTQILTKVADDFGYQLVESFASGGFRYPAFKYNAKRGPRADQYRDWQAARYAAQAEYNDRARVAAVMAGRSGAGMVQFGGSVGDTLGSFGSALEARAQAAADLKARKSKNPNDSAEDFYRKPTASLKQYLAVLKQAELYQRQWNATLTRLSGTVGSDVVDALKDMGEAGEDIIRKMAKSTVTDMKRMGDQIRRMNFAKFIQDTSADVKGQAQFQANLQALVKMGRADLASRFQDMGYDQAAGLASVAVSSKGSQLTSLNNLLATQEQYNSPDNASALKLASLIQKSGGKLGVMGLASSSGMPVGDVLGLLGRFEGTVFGKLPASAMRQIRADQALLKAGKQPSGFAMGTIIRGSDTGYYYGEPDSGGESLIPHGIDRRQRALELWRQTGRILGASIPVGSGSGRGSVIISPGAVTVSIPVSGTNATPAQIEMAAKRAVSEGMNQLVRQLNHGGGR